MIEVISGQAKVLKICETCGSVVSYVYTDLLIRKIKLVNPPRFGAYRYVECPVCKQDIRH